MLAASAPSTAWSANGGSGEPYPQSVRRAVSYFRQHLADTVKIADLTAAARVSERTLHRSFTRFLGLSPTAYLLRLRLTAVREELLRASEDNVSDIGARFGLTHFGRLSVAYRRCFGETPSATRRKSQQAQQCLATDQRRGRTLTPCLLVAASSAGHEGRETRLFAETLGEQLAASLSRLSLITVKLVRSGHYLSETDRRATAFMLTSRVVTESGRARVIIRLVEGGNGRHLWADTFDGNGDGLLRLQDRVVASVTEAARTVIMGAEIRRAREQPAWAARGRDLALGTVPLLSSPDGCARALEPLYRAMQLDPDDGLAAALAAWCHAQMVTPWNEKANQEKASAFILAERAGMLGADDPLALTARAGVSMLAQDLDTADALVRHALALDPGCVWAWERRGWLKAVTKRSQDAIADFEHALRLKGSESDGVSSLFGIGTAHWCARRYDASMLWVSRAAARRPGAPGIQAQLAGCHFVLGNAAEGRAGLLAIMRAYPQLTAADLFAGSWFEKSCPSVANVLSKVGLVS